MVFLKLRKAKQFLLHSSPALECTFFSGSFSSLSFFIDQSIFLNQICTKSLIKHQPYMHFFPSRLALTCLRNSSSLPLTWHLSWVLRAMKSVGQSWLLAHKEAAVNLSSAMAHKKSAAGMQNCASSEKKWVFIGASLEFPPLSLCMCFREYRG